MSQVSLGRPEFVPGTPPGHPTAKFLYVIFLYRSLSLSLSLSLHFRECHNFLEIFRADFWEVDLDRGLFNFRSPVVH